MESPPPPGEERPIASVIVSTYENRHGLALVLAGLARQHARGFELLVADDGSGPETAELTCAFARSASFPVRHLWQPDEGVRKGRILNRAIEAAAADLLIFLDGDCVPSPAFVAKHVSLAQPRRYLSGSTVLLGAEASCALAPSDVARGALDGLRTCRPGNRRWRRLVAAAIPGVADLFDRRLARTPVGFHGGNASLARSDAVAIGGFDERLARREDKDFGRRLRAAGVDGISVRYRIPVWHVHHERAYLTEALREESRALAEANAAADETVTAHGLAAPNRGRS
jgi:GT2 family glycosyltransferase